MIKPITIDNKKYFTKEGKETLIGKGYTIPIEDIALYDRRLHKKIVLYDYKKVKEAYMKSRRKKNIFIPKFVSDKVHGILKDYSVYNMLENKIAEKYGLTRQRINSILHKYTDPAKDKYEYLIDD